MRVREPAEGEMPWSDETGDEPTKPRQRLMNDPD